eukprot:PhM_4_TR18838/c2_g2_i1/m.39744/K17508/PTC7, PPTC7; protein phosphatase PTC7
MFRFHARAASSVAKPSQDKNEDAWFHAPHALGVADGVGMYRRLGIDASKSSRLAMQSMFEAATRVPGECPPAVVLMNEGCRAASRVPGCTTLCVAGLRAPYYNVLEVSNLGDSGCIVIRDGRTILSTPWQWHEFDFPYQAGPTSPDTAVDASKSLVLVKPHDVVVLATDGVLDNLSVDEIVDIVTTSMARSPHVDCEAVAKELVSAAIRMSHALRASTPYTEAALHHGVMLEGGKKDDTTCVVGVVEADHSDDDGDKVLGGCSRLLYTPPRHTDMMQ